VGMQKRIYRREVPPSTRITKYAWNAKIKKITNSALAKHTRDEESKYNGTREKYYVKILLASFTHDM
jgi:hypothetical protein